MIDGGGGYMSLVGFVTSTLVPLSLLAYNRGMSMMKNLYGPRDSSGVHRREVTIWDSFPKFINVVIFPLALMIDHVLQLWDNSLDDK